MIITNRAVKANNKQIDKQTNKLINKQSNKLYIIKKIKNIKKIIYLLTQIILTPL